LLDDNLIVILFVLGRRTVLIWKNEIVLDRFILLGIVVVVFLVIGDTDVVVVAVVVICVVER
jgi:hypothetical protein